jgi:hypothetical protein
MMRFCTILLLLFITVSCRSKFSKFDFKNYKYDKQVIQKLPIYDSLVSVILKNYSSIEPYIKTQSSYSYIPLQHGNDLYKQFPREAAVKIRKYLNQIGDSLVSQFEVYKDSTIKFHIKDIFIQSYHITIMERLSYYPTGNGIKRRQYPDKDTLLKKNWQYWIAFDERVGVF